MKFNKDWFKKNWFPYTVATCSAVVLYLALSHINVFFHFLRGLVSYFAPIITGLIIAYVLHPLVNLYERTLLSNIRRKELKRALSVTLTIVSVVLVIVLLMIALIPQLGESASTFINNLDDYAKSLEDILNSLNIRIGFLSLDVSGITSRINSFLSEFSHRLPEFAEQAINVSANIGRNVINTALGFVVAIYFLTGMEGIQNGTKRLFRQFMPPAVYDSIGSFWSDCNEILIKYIVYDLFDGVAVGMINWLFMVLAGIPYAVLISVVVAVTNLAPTFGPVFGAAIGAFILVLVRPFYALVFLIFTVVLQTLDGYVIKPKLFSGSLNVPPIWILITLIVGGRMFGIAGIMLAIPFAAIFNLLYTDWIEKREAADKKDAPKEISSDEDAPKEE